MGSITFIPDFTNNQKILEKITNILFSKNRLVTFLFFKIQKIRDSSSVGLVILRKKKIGCNWKIESRRAILVDPYFASKSPGHDVILTSFAAKLCQIRNFYLQIGCKIVGRKGAASFALIALLVLQISRKKGRGAQKLPQWGAG